MNEKESIVNVVYNRLKTALSYPVNGDFGLLAEVKLRAMHPDGRLMPPTYKKDELKWNRDGQHPVHHIEDRGGDKKTVELDSVQSSARRISLAAYNAYLAGEFDQPHAEIDFPDGKVLSTLEVPHRAFGHEFYLSVVKTENKKGETKPIPFKKLPIGNQLISNVPSEYLRAILQLSPAALALGVWGSGWGQKHATKIARAFESETVGIVEGYTQRSKSQLSPLHIDSSVVFTQVKSGDEYIYSVRTQTAAEQKKNKREKEARKKSGEKADKKGDKQSSSMKLANIPPSLEWKGVVASGVKTNIVINLRALLQSIATAKTNGTPDEKVWQRENDAILRTYAVAWVLYAQALKHMNSYFRSGCDLQPEELDITYKWDTVNKDEKSNYFTLSLDQAKSLYQMALQAAKERALMRGSVDRLIPSNPDGTCVNLRFTASDALNNAYELCKEESKEDEE